MDKNMNEIMESYMRYKKHYREDKLNTLSVWYEQVPANAHDDEDEFKNIVDELSWRMVNQTYGITKEQVIEYYYNQIKY